MLKIVEDEWEDKLLLAMSCAITNKSTKYWLIDSGFRNHMTLD